ncbi:hypothetical protein PQR08_11445 [Caballeronia jiangsuensis]|uniref:Uncharacterized protein n=1 Tax=Caballeronia jiangsuensis TaxID=1458357 RepID=A0ABW9CKL6_9BURK
MDVTEIRYQNFLRLFEQVKDETRRQDPDAPEKGMLKLFGERVGVREAYMSHINTRYKGIGPGSARKIEQAFKLSHGWLDRQHDSPAPANQERVKEPEDSLQQLFEACRTVDATGTRAALLRHLFESCREVDAAKTHAMLVSLAEKLTAAK